MTNNDILRRLRYAFDFEDQEMMNLFALGGKKTTRMEISNWMKQDSDEDFVDLKDIDLAIYLNGLIILKRGAQSTEPPKPEENLSNNMILKKLKIALSLSSDDIVEIFDAIGKNIGVHEISAALRNPKQRQYRSLQGQYLRQFMNGLQHKFRPS